MATGRSSSPGRDAWKQLPSSVSVDSDVIAYAQSARSQRRGPQGGQQSVTYTDPETSAFSPPPPLGPPPLEEKTDGYGWQAQAPNSPQQPYDAYQQQYQPYGQPARGYYAGPMAPATSGYAIASLICSLLGYIGVFGFGPILGII